MFNLKDAAEGSSGNGSKYQEPGIHDNVRVTDVLLEKTSIAQVPYIKLLTEGADGEKGQSNKMFLGNDKEKAEREGKRTTGWGVTARTLKELIKATHNVDEDTADGLLNNIPDIDTLVKKVSSILVGKPFRAKFKGEVSAKGLTYAILAQAESMRVTPTKLRYDANRDIKPYVGVTNTTTANTTNDLPF